MVNKDIYAEKHEAKQWCACTIIVTCCWTKCDVNEVNAHCGKIWTDGKDNRLKYSNKKREKVIKMYLENVSIRKQGRTDGSLLTIGSLSVVRSLPKEV